MLVIAAIRVSPTSVSQRFAYVSGGLGIGMAAYLLLTRAIVVGRLRAEDAADDALLEGER